MKNKNYFKKLSLALVMLVSFTRFVNAQVPSYVPTNGLVAYYPFSGNANDDSGKGNNGTVNGATLTTDRFGNVNSAYSFDGINSFIEVAHSSTQNFSIGQTVSFWIYRTGFIPAGGDQNHIISKGAQLFNGQNIWAGDADNYIVYHYISGNYNTSNSCGTASNSFSNNSWLHYVVTNDLNVMKIYQNGDLVQTSSISNPSTTLAGTAQGPMNFGKGRGHFGNERGFNGNIDDIGIWNRVLTEQEVTNLYNANQCFNNITVTETLIINVGQLSYSNPITYANNITIAPNPASTQININFNNISSLNGGTLKIINSSGQQVATTQITTSGNQSIMQLATWGGSGLYFVQIVNPQGQIVDIKKILLQ